jgi:hydroxyacylglutathione hydrolase
MMHTLPATNGGGTILPLPAFSDNYIWAIVRGNDAVVVDPGQAGPVLDFLSQHGLQLRAILLTHHHSDHVGGVLELLEHAQATVYGPASEHLPYCDERLIEGDRVSLPQLSLELKVLDVPGHTAGHIAYFGSLQGMDSPLLFCGDTLFAGGCGRIFEGTPAQMHASLAKFIALPADTQVCCAHEYTLSNLRWALAVEPANAALRQWYQRAQQCREQGRPTVPTTMALELETNPFLRTNVGAVVEAAARQAGHALDTPVAAFAALREWKNDFK